jgi:DNA-binding MarR family transcriptional regulator
MPRSPSRRADTPRGAAEAEAAPLPVRRPSPAPARRAPPKSAAAPPPVAGKAVDQVDASYLEGLIGYNARRAALSVIAVFLERMAPYGLRPVDFSILSLITHNPGITARQLCHSLGLLPPNMVGMVSGIEKRGLVERRPHPSDRRAQGLHLTPAGLALMAQAEPVALALEQDVAHKLTPQEQKTLMGLLRKIYG